MELSHTPAALSSARPAAQARAARPARTQRRVLLALLVAADTFALMAAFSLAYLTRFANPWLPYLKTYSLTFYSTLVFWVIPFWLLIFMMQGLYDHDRLFGGVDEYARVANACTFGVIVVILYSFLDRSDSSTFSRLWLVFAWLYGIGCVMLERFLLRRFVYWRRQHGHFRRRALVLGTNAEAQAIAEQLRAADTTGLEIAGFVAEDDHVPPLPLPLLGPLSDLGELVAKQNVDEIIVASTAVTREQLLETYNAFGLDEDVELRLSPGLFEILTTGARVKQTGSVPLVSLNHLRITGLDAWLKSALDLGLIVLSLPVSLPLFLALCALIKLDSPGPVIHRRRVLGLRGQPFDAYKFRTMAVDAEDRLAALLDKDPALHAEYERTRKLKQDPRVTRSGAWLRRTSLDELPQLLNVLRGHMSLVGPRMIAPAEIELYGKWWMNLLTVKPGLTGPWQVMGRSDLPYDERVRLSMGYVRNHSIWLDLQILYQTIGVVLSGKGAY
jgi:exopolysaccharide biosynthesis polyprenyl glycosylphosphotransferase